MLNGLRSIHCRKVLNKTGGVVHYIKSRLGTSTDGNVMSTEGNAMTTQVMHAITIFKTGAWWLGG